MCGVVEVLRMIVVSSEESRVVCNRVIGGSFVGLGWKGWCFRFV